jgi:hypothetical protein
MRGAPERPAGLLYPPGLVDSDEERTILAEVSTIDLTEAVKGGRL